MTRRYNSRLITSRHSYTPEEVAQLYGINKKTVFRWLQEDLRPLEENTKPLLIMGDELRRFLSKKREKQKISLGSNEYFCLKCRKAVLSKSGTEKQVPTGNKIGKLARIQYFRRAKCVNCGTVIYRLVGVSQKD